MGKVGGGGEGGGGGWGGPLLLRGARWHCEGIGWGKSSWSSWVGLEARGGVSSVGVGGPVLPSPLVGGGGGGEWGEFSPCQVF